MFKSFCFLIPWFITAFKLTILIYYYFVLILFNWQKFPKLGMVFKFNFLNFIILKVYVFDYILNSYNTIVIWIITINTNSSFSYIKYTNDNISYYALIQHIAYCCIICHWCDGKYKIYYNIRGMGKLYRYMEKTSRGLAYNSIFYCLRTLLKKFYY